MKEHVRQWAALLALLGCSFSSTLAQLPPPPQSAAAPVNDPQVQLGIPSEASNSPGPIPLPTLANQIGQSGQANPIGPSGSDSRMHQGPDGRWYVLEENTTTSTEQQAKKDAQAKKDGKVISLNDEISKMLTVNIKGKGKLQIYGFARGDAYWGSGRFFPSLEIPFYTLPEDSRFGTGPLTATNFPRIPGAVPVHSDDSSFTMNARLSRIGLLYTGAKAKWLHDAELEGRIEMDFYNTIDNPIASRAMPRIRHGYAKATWDEFSIMLGQYWDIASPLYPFINDDLLMWNAGNLGDRRPQLRLNWDRDLGCDNHFIMTLGLTATDAVDRTDFGGDGLFDGEEDGLPGFQGRVATKRPVYFPCNQKKYFEVGVWGLVSGDATNVPIGLSRRSHFTSWAVGADWQVPLTEKLALRGEAWYGSNLDDYRGGIDQGINSVLGEEIDSWGGWIELVYKPREWYQVAVGTTLDDPQDGDVAGLVLGREYNRTFYLGNRFLLGGGLTFAFDVEIWETGFANFRRGRSERFKFWLMQVF